MDMKIMDSQRSLSRADHEMTAEEKEELSEIF